MYATSVHPSLFRAVAPVKALVEERAPSLTLPDDEELVSRAQKGDRWAEEALYRRHVRTVTKTVTRLLARAHEAEDVVQDTFVTAFEQLHQLRQSGSFKFWLLRIAVRQAHRRFRRRRLLRTFGLDREEDDTALARCVDRAAGPEIAAELSKLDRVLQSLSSKERIVWILRNVEGYPWNEIATLCECSLATVKRCAVRAEARVGAHVRLEPLEEAP